MATRFTPATIGSMTDAIDVIVDELHAASGVGAQTVNTTATAVSMTAAQALAGSYVNNVAGAMALTLPTAAALVAAFPNVQVGSRFILYVINLAASGTLTLTTNTGLTITGGHGTATLATATSQILEGKFTNVTAGSETVTFTPVLKTAS